MPSTRYSDASHVVRMTPGSDPCYLVVSGGFPHSVGLADYPRLAREYRQAIRDAQDGATPYQQWHVVRGAKNGNVSIFARPEPSHEDAGKVMSWQDVVLFRTIAR